jgi:hypothetical protein
MVQVILGTAPDDVALIPCAPHDAPAAMWQELLARGPGRGLRTVGFAGLIGAEPCLVLDEPLNAAQVASIATAFGSYIGGRIKQALTPDSFASEIERAQGEALEREHMARICALHYPPGRIH